MPEKKSIGLLKALARLKENDRFVILSHTNPDGDTVSSALGLSLLLLKMGKKVDAVVCDKEIPEYLRFIAGSERFVTDYTPDDGEFVVSVDVASPAMLGANREKFENRTDLRIDHHGVSTPFAKENFVRAEASSCAEILAELAKKSGYLDKEIAEIFLVGILTDSGSFRYGATSGKTHRMAAALLDAGADNAKVCASIFENKPVNEMRASSFGICRMQLFREGSVALSIIRRRDMEENGLKEEDFSELVSLLRTMKGVKLAIFLRETGDNEYKLSLRSEEDVDSAVICKHFGGGGHRCAAGATVFTDDPEKIAAEVIGLAGDNLG